MSIISAVFSPHPPILLPSVGSKKDRAEIKKTIDSLESLGKKMKKINPDLIIISSPHPEWGFNVPLFFLADNFKGKIKQFLIGSKSPDFYYQEGKKFYKSEIQNPELFEGCNLQSKISLIASGDLSHCLRKEGPYGFKNDGPKFDKALMDFLKNKDVDNILKLNEKYPEAGECGLRSFCFLLGILEGAKINWQPEILSYEGPFGVGYLVADFKLK
jgi:aromatic ring-opening dioxygenase LigB subunit